MPLKFCPKCGTLMVPKNVGGNIVLVCRKCGYTEKVDKGFHMSTVSETKNEEKKKILVIDEEVQVKVLPKTHITCPKCGNNEAYFWTVQTRAADEPATRFFRCTKCGYTWREYD